jgi:hypothetical protein
MHLKCKLLYSIKKYTNKFILTSEKHKLKKYIERVNNNKFKGEEGYHALLKFLEDILGYEEYKHISFDYNVDIGFYKLKVNYGGGVKW